jgi:hypothetical protein
MSAHSTEHHEGCDRYSKEMAAADRYAQEGNWGMVAAIIRRLVEERPIEIKLIEIRERQNGEVKRQTHNQGQKDTMPT